MIRGRMNYRSSEYDIIGQRTLAFTRLMLRNFSCNSDPSGNTDCSLCTRNNHSFHTLRESQMNNTPNICNRVITGASERCRHCGVIF
jgi:hypothetical protein